MRECPVCKDITGGGVAGVGFARNTLGSVVHLLLIAADDTKKGGAPHPWLRRAEIPQADQKLVELTTKLCGRPPGLIGHDSRDLHTAVKTIIKAAGLPEDWGLCETCGGDAEVTI